MSGYRRRAFFLIFGVLLSALFCYFCLRTLGWKDIQGALWAPHPWLLASAMLFNFVILGLKTWTWKRLLDPLRAVSFATLFEIQHVGCMANVLLPLKAGEFLKSSLVQKKFSIPYPQVLTSVAIERYLAGFSLMLLALGVAFFYHFPAWIQTGALVLAMILFALQLGLWVLWKKNPSVENWRGRHPWLYRGVVALEHIGAGSRALRSGKSFLILSLISLGAWLAEIAMLRVLESAFQLEVSWIASCFALIAVNLSIALPSAPGNLGSFEFAVILAYTAFGVDKATAFGLAFYFHMLQLVPVTIIGLFFYFRWGLRGWGLKSAAAAEPFRTS